MNYRIYSKADVSTKRRQIYCFAVVVEDVNTQTEMSMLANTIVRDLLGTSDLLLVWCYLEADAIQWGGYIARIEARKDDPAQVIFDNDPALRKAIYEDVNG